MDVKASEFRRIYKEAHTALHRCWSKAVGTPDYVKADWNTIANTLGTLGREVATGLGLPRDWPLI